MPDLTGPRRLFYVTATIVLLAGICYCRSSKAHPLGSLTVDYDAPYEQMVQVVHDVANDGHILGTSMFAKDEDIPGAEIANKTTAFGKWAGNGTVIYKVRTGTLAPTHFIDSSDVGTLAVRYIVQPVDAKNSRVTIEAVFVEDGHRHRHLSDGSVETSELGSITQRIRTLQEQAREAEAAKRWSAEEHKIKDLERTLKEAQSQADAAKIQVQQLQARVDEMRKATYARVKGERMDKVD